MNKRKRTFELKTKPKILSGYTVVGPKEGDGALGEYFDKVLTDDLFGEKTYELAESKMQQEAVKEALKRSGISKEEIDLTVSGDLLNQIYASCFAARELETAFLGLYGACSTFGESLIVASLLINTGMIEKCCCSTSSHFSSAERQYRYPLELGNQRPPTSQWTVTGAGASILSADGDGVSIDKVTIGRVIDFGIDDVNNMGAAMAPAAADTISAFFGESGEKPEDFDMIVTGDLGRYGGELLLKLLYEKNINISKVYHDCGAMIYKPEQQTYQGGSGAGCCNVVFNAFIADKMLKKELKKVLLVPTGALLSKDSPLQGQTIPGIAHAISFRAPE